jgi:hypothetical protein
VGFNWETPWGAQGAQLGQQAASPVTVEMSDTEKVRALKRAGRGLSGVRVRVVFYQRFNRYIWLRVVGIRYICESILHLIYRNGYC